VRKTSRAVIVEDDWLSYGTGAEIAATMTIQEGAFDYLDASVRKGDVLAVIETDEAAMEMEAYDEGVLARILVEEGASVPIGTPIAVIGVNPYHDVQPAVLIPSQWIGSLARGCVRTISPERA
jgi:hypothetical protein